MLQQAREKESAVSSMLEYTIITAILMLLFLTVTAASDAAFLTGPSETLRSQEYQDVVTSVSMRIVDLAIVAPQDGRIECRFDLPGGVGNQPYSVHIAPGTVGSGVGIEVGDGEVTKGVTLGGIGSYMPVCDMTSRSETQYICFESGGEL